MGQGKLDVAVMAGRAHLYEGYTPAQVRPSAELLRESVKHYVFISAVSVYGDPQDRPVRESHPRLPPAGEGVTQLHRRPFRCVTWAIATPSCSGPL